MFNGVDFKIQGQKAEAKFQFDALVRDLIVSKPYGDNSTYDFITDFKGTLKRVQVKSVSVKDKGTNRYRISATNSRHKSDCKYTKADIDIVACYIFDLDMWYLVPIEEISGAYINAYPDLKNSKGKYEIYKENWNILKT